MPANDNDKRNYDERNYDGLIEAIQDAIADHINDNGPVRAAVLEAALGYHLSLTFENYPEEIRPKAIEHFCNTLRQHPPANLN